MYENSDYFCQAPTSSIRSPWLQSISIQVAIVTNLIHAALLIASAFVVAYRGDVVWLYFVRHTVFFWSIVAILYFIADLTQLILSLRLIISGIFAVLSTSVLLQYDYTCRLLRKKQKERNLVGDVFYGGTIAVQITAIVYLLLISSFWFKAQFTCEDDDDEDRKNRLLHMLMPDSMSGNMPLFVMAYSETAHGAFLLAMLHMGATYCTDYTTIAGAAMTAAWRMMVAAMSFIHILSSFHFDSVRDYFSFLFTTIEMVTMIPLLAAAAAFLLSRSDNRQNVIDHEYEQPDKDSADVEKEEQDNSSVDGIDIMVTPVRRFRCLTLSQMVDTSHHKMVSFEPKQITGAKALLYGSIGLFVEMTIENVLLLSNTFIGTETAHMTYKWGLHVVVMYVFVTIMSVQDANIYRRFARPILSLACPTGSVIAVWQIYHYNHVQMTVWSWVILFLFIIRAFCGIAQTYGLYLLDNLTPVALPQSQQDEPSSSENDEEKPSTSEDYFIDLLRRRAMKALYMVYIPALVLYVLVSTYLGSCYEPMISKMLPPEELCTVHEKDLMVIPNWPGLALFFHFGIVLCLFAFDGLQRTLPSYKPTLLIATLFAIHLTILMFSHFVLDAIQTELWTTLSRDDVIRRVLMMIWMCTTCYVSMCMHRLWKVRLLPM